MKRSGFKRGQPSLDRKRAIRLPALVPKALGKRLVPKDEAPWRNDEHKRRVVLCGCLVVRHARPTGGIKWVEPKPCFGPVDPHHVTLWRKGWGQPSDALVVPLCRGHHTEAHEGPGKELGFQARYGIDFARWIERHSAVGAAAIAQLLGAQGKKQ